MKVARKFTVRGQDPFSTVAWGKRSSKISNPDGSVVFEMNDAEIPESWSQLATDIMVSKYFRKAGVPLVDEFGKQKMGADGKPLTGPEKSARQVIHRLAGCWRYWGETHGYFDSAEDAHAFYDELCYMMVHQMAAPNSPQWFNTGLNWAYGISGPAQGHSVVDPKTGEVCFAPDAYTHPQPHACFIQSVTDDLVNEGGIMDLWVREARLFKYGSGTGTNFSNLRGDGEKLSGGGKSSGLMSWLKIGDRAASAIKSGGTTRRAAKMVCLDMDHPDIVDFVNWKVREEIKVAALAEGFRHVSKQDQEMAKKLGLKLDYDFNGEGYLTVSGQNSNNSVRIPDSFFDALDGDGEWQTKYRTSNKIARTYKAKDVWDQICYAAWRCADPGVQYDTTINAWHTCPSAGRINASNPCSEYMFLDNTACNLASLNVLKFYDAQARSFDVERYEHAVDVWTIVLEVSVLMASFPSREIALLSYKYRTLGLGYANLGAMLMQAGIAYDSEEGRAICAMLSAILTGRANRQSALLAKELGAFPGFDPDRSNMLRVMRNHRRAAHGVARESDQYENLRIRPVPIDHAVVNGGTVGLANARQLLAHSTKAWDDALAFGEQYGYRNAQTTVIAPTGTIGLLMDCDTTGVEPDFALVKFKKLAGGGYFKIANESVRPALAALGYSEAQIHNIMQYILGTLHLDVVLPDGVKDAKPGMTFADWLRKKGFSDTELKNLTDAMPGTFELAFAFSVWSFGPETFARLGLDHAKAQADTKFNLLRKLGLTAAQIDVLNTVICGTATIEGAPHLKVEHLPVFDCANKCGKLGQRFIAPEGHIRMMAAAQPFISGAISKTINLPNEAKVEDVAAAYRLSWELGLKANALYRDGSKLSQPLSSTTDEAKSEILDEEESTPEALEEKNSAKQEVARSVAELAGAVAAGQAAVAQEKVTDVVHRPMRRRLSDTRRSLTHKFNVAGHQGYLTVGLYEDGKPGELFITMSKEGSTIGGLMDSLGTAISVALQYGVPVESLVGKFSHQRFEPAGMTTNRDIPFAKSLVDYIFRWMGMQFIPGFREQHAPRRDGEGEAAPAKSEAAKWAETPADRIKGYLGDLPEGGSNGGTRLGAEVKTSASVVKMVTERKVTAEYRTEVKAEGKSSALSEYMDSVSDAPPCDVCGSITVRSGTCHKCLNCGNSLGCS
ncbi:MAG: adenosylcobalamin-dependent ribonucleoside-diphosphate reductase [Planctomycetes bacterium]|nr:adenosylcobalamin-dependent ribonucleoside-diphosphate reductase [Planctomycetota bacterium]